MSNIKKIIAVVLALVMALSVATIAFAADEDNSAYSVTITSDKATIAAGETATVTVKVTTNFYASAMSIPVFFDNTKVTASAGEVLLNGVGEKANIATETSSDVEKLFEGSGHTKDDYGVRALIYIGKKDDTLKMYNNEAVMSFTVTAKDGATGAVVLECISTAVKTSSNPSGTLYISKNGSGNATLDSLPEVVDNATVTGATTTINIASAAEPADLELTAAGATDGVVIDTRITFGGQYAGAVYGFKQLATATFRSQTYLNNSLTASNGGSLAVTKGGTGFSTGTAIEVLNADGSSTGKVYVVIIFGDVNKDGLINNTDIAAVKGYASKPATLTDLTVRMAANCQNIGNATMMYNVNNADIAAVKAYASNASTKVSQATLGATVSGLTSVHNNYK